MTTTRRRHPRTPTPVAQRPVDPQTLSDVLAQGPSRRRAVLAERLEQLVVALESSSPGREPDPLLAAVERALTPLGPEEAWLALSVLTARLPEVDTVQRLVRAANLDGVLPALFDAWRDAGQLAATTWPSLEVVSGMILVDLHHTARSRFGTGIQRVARETARRWLGHPDVVIIGWTEGYGAYRRLPAKEVELAFRHGGAGTDTPPSEPNEPVLVPWKCVHLVAELPVEGGRAQRYQASVMFSRSASGLIGHDCVPVTASETTAEGMSAGFASLLAAAAHVDRIATTCRASEVEYRGWRAMLAGAGLSGPDIRCVPLPVDAHTPTDQALAQTRDLLNLGNLPIVLSVGSHEPRKNHLALLHAAEVLWREGLTFSLVFVGGNSWNSAEFEAQVETLRGLNRPVQTILGLPDDLLWAAYRLAYCTVFASLHEGFGLPVAESLASGTPVITSNFGSMRDLASHGGALLVDPRDDTSITAALRQLLTDRPLRDRLAAETATLPRRTWDHYATETWAYLVDGTTDSISP
jgi:glycosyltransferase involved in cell wall biosynthesis